MNNFVAQEGLSPDNMTGEYSMGELNSAFNVDVNRKSGTALLREER